MKTFSLFQHQSPKVNEVIYSLQSGEKVVLSGCPGSGKTEMSFAIIDWAVKFGMKRILVLAHSTNVLKQNYKERFDSYNFPFAQNVTIDIPQNWFKIKGKYDFVIIDEAHQNYLAPMVQKIVENIPMQLLLTGTPSKLVAKGGFKIISLAMESVPSEYFSKVQIELVTTPYKWTETDYGQDGNLREDTVFVQSDTEIAVENVLKSLMRRVTLSKIKPETWNQITFINRLKVFFTKKQLNKTMIACSRQSQAEQVYKYLNEKLGINAAISHSGNDVSSNVFDEFLENKYDVLVVVNRGRLGYSDNNLYNMIDMTGTKNADLIYQMFARVVRGDKSQQKYFIKVSPTGAGMMDLTDINMRMALSLMFESVVTTFNGKNFNGMFVPVIKKMKTEKLQSKSGNTVTRKVAKFTYPEYTNDIIVQLKDLYVNVSNDLSIYKRGNIQEILNQYRDYHPAGFWDIEQNLYCEAKKYKTYQDFFEFSRVAFEKMRDKKILHNVFPNFEYGKTPRKITKELVIEVLESNKYKNISELYKKQSRIGVYVRNSKELIDKYFPNRKTFNNYSEDEIRDIAKKCKNRNDMDKRYRGAMRKARIKYPHILDEVFGDKYDTQRKHSEEDFVEVAKGYNRRYDMEKENKGLFSAARQRFPHIIEKCFPKKNPSK